MSARAGRDIVDRVQRGGERLHIVGTGAAGHGPGQRIGRLGITLAEGRAAWPAGSVQTHRSGRSSARRAACEDLGDVRAHRADALAHRHRSGVAKNISGPVSIAEFAGISAYLGVTAFLAFLAIISVSWECSICCRSRYWTAGRWFINWWKRLKGSPLSERAQNFGQQVGIALLVVLMSLAFYNDISRHLN